MVGYRHRTNVTQQPRSNIPRSSRAKKRSSTNLSNLRLAPLSTSFVDPPQATHIAKSPYEDIDQVDFVRSHTSYLQGKSAPTTPGILSRNSSRKQLGAGLSRRGSLYERDSPDKTLAYGVGRVDLGPRERAGVGSGVIPKAKSEAALLVYRRGLSGPGVPLRRTRRDSGVRDRDLTPKARPPRYSQDDNWLTRAGAATSSQVQESKGQSWLASRDSSTALNRDSTDDDDDDNYEELAASTASTVRLQFADDELSPYSTRTSRWGSRYGSRTGSRRTSRAGSMTAFHTPMAGAIAETFTGSYFAEEPRALVEEPDFVDPEEESEPETELETLTRNQSFGLGGIVDRLMGFNLWKVEERTTDSEGEEQRSENPDDRVKRRRAIERPKAVDNPSDSQGSDEVLLEEGAWKDAAWLLSVASKAMF